MKTLTICMLLLAGAAVVAGAQPSAEATLTIDASRSAGAVSPMLYGLMTEEINHAYDGGLYAELIQNRAFLDNVYRAPDWSVVDGGDDAATIELDAKTPLNDQLTKSLKVSVKSASTTRLAGAANDGYWGIPVRPNTEYHASFYAKAAAGFSGSVTLAIESDDGSAVYAKGVVPALTQDWKRYELTLATGSVAETDKTRFALLVDRPGTFWIDLVSLFPPTYGNQPNGFRTDLMQMLIDLHPKFLRFPGGNYLEGDTIDTRFDWKKTIGPLDRRPGHWGPWGYRSTDGMGLLEFLMWCEDMHAQPVLAVYAGYSLHGDHVKPGPDLQPYVQDALDEIQYVTGPVTSKWGAERARDGHPEPFTLHYVEIGNEDFFDQSGSYDARFAQFYDAIKAAYPDLNVISTVGNEHQASKRVHSRTPDLLDEHYYLSADTFLSDSPTHFNNYDRKGPKIFVGEWASYETAFPPWDPQSQQQPPTPDMKAALGDAAWMAAMERASDLVVMQCYAPLLVNVNEGARQWRPDLIGYDGLHVYGSPSYYAMKMFSTNLGDEILSAATKTTAVQSSVTRDRASGEIFVKLVNPTAKEVPLRIDLRGAGELAPTATVITLAAAPDATNSIDQPTNVVPVTSTFSGVKQVFTYPVPPSAIVVLKLAAR